MRGAAAACGEGVFAGLSDRGFVVLAKMAVGREEIFSMRRNS
jgi:hypothetical protein